MKIIFNLNMSTLNLAVLRDYGKVSVLTLPNLVAQVI